MTSTPVKDVKFLVNFVALQDAKTAITASENTGKTTNFSDIIGQLSNRANLNPNIGKRENLTNTKPEKSKPDPINPSESPTANESLTANETLTTNETEAKKPLEVSEANEPSEETGRGEEVIITPKLTEELAKAAEEALNTIALMTESTKEEVLETLNTLGLTPESLLSLKNLSEVVTALENTDLLALMTDENLYESFTALTNEIQAITEELTGEAKLPNLSPDELATIITQLNNAETNEELSINPDEITESANLTNETANEQMAKPGQEITIVIEKDGALTEISAKADENGNLKATKEVVTTQTKPQVTIESKETSDGEPQQNESQSQEQNLNSQESLLNNLLQNRLNNIEAKFEPAVPEAPNTEQIMNQIMDFMKVKLSPGTDSLEMQLHPAHLGTVGVKIVSSAGIITAHFTAENEIVKAAIESQIIDLKDNMRAQGIKVETIEVDVKSQEFDSKLWQGQDEDSREEQAGQKSRRRLNLSGIDLDELLEDLNADEKLAAEMMIENGQTVDFSA